MSQSKSAVTTQADKRGEVELILLSTKLDGSGRTNVLEWLDKHGSVLGSKHRYAASVLFSTYKNYIVPPPDAIFQEEGMPNWSADQMKFLEVDAMKAFSKEKREQETCMVSLSLCAKWFLSTASFSVCQVVPL